MQVQGYFRVFNFFDLGEAFDLEKLRTILRPNAPAHPSANIQRAPEYSQTQNISIQEVIGPINLPTGESLEASLKYYWFGVASVELATPFRCEFDSFSCESSRWMNAPEVETAAEELLRARLQQIGPVVIRPATKWLDEDYLVIDVHSALHPDERSATAAELLQTYGDQIAELVRGETVALAASEREEVLRSALSYYPTDLVVVGWGAALVYDKPDATSAVIDILEYANTQLLEFRYYDELLTTLLSNVYSSLEGHESFGSRWRLSRRAGRLNRLRLDVMDLAERTEYSVKFISDTFYARVYRVSSARIGVEDYKTLVGEKLKTAGELYDFMVAEFNERRMFAVEIVVAVLVLLDVILLLRGK
jgi:hypothetical protein